MTRSQYSRRTFLTGGAGVAVASLTPYFLTGAQTTSTQSKNDRIGVAVIGTGGRGSFIGHQAAALGDLVACCDVDHKRAEGFASRYAGKCKVCKDYRRVLDRKDVQAITIGVPDHWHAKIIVEALKAGKDIYCEKPLALTIEEGRLICRTARQTARIVQVGTQQRSEYDSLFLQAVALCRSGRLGEKLTATASVGQAKRGGPFASTAPPAYLDWDFWLGPSPQAPYCPQRCHYDFRWWFDYSGGQVTYWGVHHVDIAMWAMGLASTGPVQIEGWGDFPKIENGYDVPTTFHAKMKFANGNTIVLNSDRNGLLLGGEKGRIAVNRRRLLGTPVETLSKHDRDWLRDEVVRLYRGKQPGSHMGNFFECVKDRSMPISDVFTHHRSLSACHLCNIAMKLGRTLHWDPAKEDFIGDAEASRHLSRPWREPYGIVA